jgi:hypothetical protein
MGVALEPQFVARTVSRILGIWLDVVNRKCHLRGSNKINFFSYLKDIKFLQVLGDYGRRNRQNRNNANIQLLPYKYSIPDVIQFIWL